MEVLNNESLTTLNVPVMEATGGSWADKLGNFPRELKEKKIWCVWRRMLREGKDAKVPYQISGARAKSNDDSTWCLYEDACIAADGNPELGVGLFTDGMFTFVDCDHCCDPETGEIEPWAKEVVSRVGSYTEYSPSLEGTHAFVLGAVSSAIKRNNVEMYSRGRFATVTGLSLPDTPGTLTQGDVESLRRDVAEGRLGRRETKFDKLWCADAQYIEDNYRGDDSAADQALANLLAMKFSGNYEAIEAAFFDSEPGKRKKWQDREDYRRRTIGKAIDWYKGSTGGVSDSSSGEDWESLFHTYADIKNAPPLRFAIDGFLQEHGVTFLAGLPGHGKTLVMLNIVKALLEGGFLFGYEGFKVLNPSKRILYLSPEVSLTPFSKRLNLFGLIEHVKEKRLFIRTLSAKEPLSDLKNPRLVKAVCGADVFLDTAIRFMPGDENSASDNKVFADMLFALIGAGARCIIGAHHSAKVFGNKKNQAASLENAMRGSVDIGAMLSCGWSLRQIDKHSNRIRVENIKPRDFEPCGPFEIEGRPYIETTRGFRISTPPSEEKSAEDARRELAKQLRAQGRTQAEVAQELGVDRSTIAKWEKKWKLASQPSD